MKEFFKDFWYWYSEPILATIGFILFIISVAYGLLLGQANVYKYNCDLERRPSLSTTFWIADETYAYDPQGFCNKLKEKMAQE